MNILKNYWVKFCSILYAFLILLIFLATFCTAHLNHQVQNTILLFFIAVVLLALCILFKETVKKLLYNKYFFYIAIILGILLHLTLLCLRYADVAGDYATLYGGAKAFADGTFVKDHYVALFPYLWGYISFAGVIFKIFGSSYHVVVGINIVLNLISVFLVYKIFTRLWNKDVARIGAIFWIYNPLSLFWCIYPFGGTGFYTFFFASILSTILLFQKEKKYRYAILLGILLFFTNQFRPIMPIYFIALFLYVIFKTVVQKECSIKKYFLLFLMVFLVYFGCGKGSMMYLEHVNQIKASRNSIGWSLFCGGSLESDGRWSEADGAVLAGVLEQEDDPTKIQNIMTDKALKRYQDHGFKIIPLYIQKFRVLTGSTAEYSWNSFYSLVLSKRPIKIMDLVFNLTHIYYFILLILNLAFAYDSFKYCNEDNRKSCSLLILFVLGFTAASLLLEVAFRYYLPAVSIFVLGASIGLYSIFENKILCNNRKRCNND